MDDRQLLAQLRESGPKAAAAQRFLYSHYAPQFLAYLKRRGIPEEDRQDIVQQAFLKALTSIDSILAASNPKSYFWQILVRLQYDWFRRRHRKVPDGTDEAGKAKYRYVPRESHQLDVEGREWFDIDMNQSDNPTFESLENEDLQECFNRASIAFMESHPARAVFIELHVVAQMNDAEISEAIGRTKHATAQFLSQSRKKFVEVLRRMCGPEAHRETELG